MALRLCVCTLGVLMTTSCGGSSHKNVPLPPVGAGSGQVVAAYVAALSAHDLRTARALLTPAHARDVESAADSWFTNVRSITRLHLDRPAIEGAPPLRAIVGVRFVLDQYRVESMENGPTDWSYMLVRKSPAQRWLIAGEGMG
jgi:hypothetical protein